MILLIASTRMSQGQAKMTDAKLGAKFLELGGVKLVAIVSYNDLWDTEATYNVCPYKGCNFCLGYGCQWLGLYPFGEIIYRHYCKFGVISSRG